MRISILSLCILILSGVSASSATDDSEHCRASKKLDELCGTHTFHSVKPILNYVDQLQKEQLNNNCDNKQNEIDDLREKVQQLQLKIAEGTLNEDLINLNNKLQKFKEDLLSSKDTYIKELKTRITELQNTNQVFKQNVESVNKEIAQLKMFIKEILDVEISKIDSNASKLRYYDDRLKKNNKTFAEYSVQIKVKEDSLKSCQLMLNETRNVASEYMDQLKGTKDTIAENSAVIDQLTERVQRKKQALRESQIRLNANECKLKNQNVIIEQKEQEISELKEQILENELWETKCTGNSDSNSVHNVVIPNLRPFPILCPELTVIQQRINGKEDFNRNWETYKNGFGELTGDFFLGLENIHRLTSRRPHKLHIYMEELNGKTYYAHYDNFRIAGESDKYKLLSLGEFTGTAGDDRLRKAEHKMFATFDSENPIYRVSCPASERGGWWYEGGPCTDRCKPLSENCNDADSPTRQLNHIHNNEICKSPTTLIIK